MNWSYYNSNPKGFIIDDCVVRAIALGLSKDYYLVLQELTNYAIQNKLGMLIEYEKVFGGYLDEYGERITVGKIGRRKARVADLSNILDPDATYIVLVGSSNSTTHLTCIKSYEVLDTWDCRDEIVRSVWEVKDV